MTDEKSGLLRGRAILGTFFHAPVRGEVEVLADTLIVVDQSGTIAEIILPDDAGYQSRIAGFGGDLVCLPEDNYVLPGFVDAHIHAPQYAQIGRALDEPLEVWLQKYTFPIEARYADPVFARERYETLVADLLASGTTTALYFATIHLESTKLLADICIARGQRALVGKVAMDNKDNCPDDYRDESPDIAVAATEALIEYIGTHEGNTGKRVLPCITPRFIPACSDGLLRRLGALATRTGCHVQTHCSEGDWEHNHVHARYGHSDAEALDRFGLLTRRSVLAHSNFLSGADMDRVAARQSAVAHCPISNVYFANAVFPLREALRRGVNVALGTDISGGPIATIFDAARGAVQASRVLEDGVDPALPKDQRGRPGSRIDMATAFHLATAGGGVALDLPVGVFAPGYKFDAMMIDTDRAEGSIRLFGETDSFRILETILYGATKANIAAVWVDGNQVAGS